MQAVTNLKNEVNP